MCILVFDNHCFKSASLSVCFVTLVGVMQKTGFHFVSLQKITLNTGYTENSSSGIKQTWVQISAPVGE